MTLLELKKYFTLIREPKMKTFLEKCLENAPGYFWDISSSSTGKYHPTWALGKGGLVRHTAAAMYFGSELSNTFGLTVVESDVAIVALGIHDTLKYGIDYDVRYHDMHPYLPKDYYKDFKGIIGEDLYNEVMSAVSRHMGNADSGKWNILNLQLENRIHYVVHLADYFSSRKKVNFSDFDNMVFEKYEG